MKERLENATPLRLSFREGTWSFSYQSLMRVSDVIFRPVLHIVEGGDAITSVLERMGDQEGLADSAGTLIQKHGDEDTDPVSFEPDEQSWVPVSPSPPGAEIVGAVDGGSSHSISPRRLKALEARVARLERLVRASGGLEGIGGRIAKLEAATKNLGAGLPATNPVFTAEADPAPDVPPDDQEPKNVESAPLRESGGEPPAEPGGLQMPPTVVESDEASPAAFPEVADQEADNFERKVPERPSDAAKKPPRIASLPPIQDFQAVLRMLVGEETELMGVPPDASTTFSEETDTWYISQFLSDENEVIGAVLGDITAAIYIGGGLLMMPEASLREQLETQQVEDDIIDALSEVFNNLSSVINEHDGSVHVRTTPVEVLDVGLLPWVDSPRSQREMEESHGGRIVIISL